MVLLRPRRWGVGVLAAVCWPLGALLLGAAGLPEGCLQALVSTGAEAIERDGKVVNTNK